MLPEDKNTQPFTLGPIGPGAFYMEIHLGLHVF